MSKINVTFQSVWHEGIIESDAKFDVIKNEVLNIKKSNEGVEFEHLIDEYMIYNDIIYPLELNSDNEYYMTDEIYSAFKINNPILCAKYNLTM